IYLDDRIFRKAPAKFRKQTVIPLLLDMPGVKIAKARQTLTIGTADGANVEIRSEVGAENIFIFGLAAAEVAKVKATGYQPLDFYHANAELRAVLDMIGSGFFSPDEPDRFKPIIDALLHHGDDYLLLADYASYIACQKEVELAYQDREQWVRKTILNVANMGEFSSDRTITQYADQIWDAKPVVPVE
ncbi:MAG: glycogen/starch/alpha-glucan phosphorylase, partial [Nitrosospira sp.]|nr:glycogen/starch/alpha-glucan phosphorylase [Nitrosospira sp.]